MPPRSFPTEIWRSEVEPENGERQFDAGAFEVAPGIGFRLEGRGVFAYNDAMREAWAFRQTRGSGLPPREESASMSTHSAPITCPNCRVGEDTGLACRVVGPGHEGVATNQVQCEVCGLYANFAEIRKTEGERMTKGAVVERATALLVARFSDLDEIAEMTLFDGGDQPDLSTYSFGT